MSKVINRFLWLLLFAFLLIPVTAAYATDQPILSTPALSADTEDAVRASGDSVSILEGSTYTLSASGLSGAITWSSSNTAAATVSSSGVVTGVKAGTATVTASVGGTVQRAFTVYVRIANGMYYINRGSARLGTTGRVAENTRTSLYSPVSSGSSQLSQLWKITYLSEGYYSIRPMYKLDMGLHASSNLVDITRVSTTDTLNSVALSNRWGIEYTNGGYVFKYVNSSSLAMYAASPYPGSSVTTATYSSSNSGFIWTISKVTSISNQVILIDTSTGSVLSNASYSVEPGKTLTLNDMHICASFVSSSSNDQSMTWSSNSSSAALVNSTTGAVTGVSYESSATITASHIHITSAYSKSYTLTVDTPPSSPPLVPQEKSKWCWAATGQMLALSYDASITASQSDAVRYVTGSVNDNSGFPEDTKRIAEYLLSTVSDDTDFAYTDYGSILTETALVNYLNANHAVAIHRGIYVGDDVNRSRMGGHALIICGYVTISGTKHYMLLDPLPENEGSVCWMTYEEIVCDEASITYFWDAVIAADISYFNNTISIK